MSSNKASPVTKLFNVCSPALVWLLSGFYFLVFSFDISVPLTLDKFDPGPTLLPRLLGAGLLCGGLVQILHNLLVAQTSQIHPAKHGSARLATTVFFFILLLPVAGFHVTAAMFSIIFMFLMKVGWLRAILSTTIIVVVIHLIFIEIFMIALPSIPF